MSPRHLTLAAALAAAALAAGWTYELRRRTANAVADGTRNDA